jgi:hypothetical protein
VVGRLVEEQQVGLLQQQPAQGDPAPLAARKLRDAGVSRRQAQGVHGDLQRTVHRPGVDRVDLLLESRLLVDQLVEVCVGIAHRLADRVVPVD